MSFKKSVLAVMLVCVTVVLSGYVANYCPSALAGHMYQWSIYSTMLNNGLAIDSSFDAHLNRPEDLVEKIDARRIKIDRIIAAIETEEQLKSARTTVSSIRENAFGQLEQMCDYVDRMLNLRESFLKAHKA